MKMSVFLFMYGGENHCVRIGTIGLRPLVYAVYKYSNEDQLPRMPGQTYRDITADQFDWVLEHDKCDISYVPGENGSSGNLECRTHRCFFQIFTDGPVPFYDWLDDRQV